MGILLSYSFQPGGAEAVVHVVLCPDLAGS